MASPLEVKLTRYFNVEDLSGIDGSEITLLTDYNPKPGNGEEDITETVKILIEGAKSTVISTVNSINEFLDDARRRNGLGFGDKVYIRARSGTADEWKRSEIIDGRVSLSDDGIRAGLSSGDRTPASLTITRRGYFEDSSKVYLPLVNNNGTANIMYGDFLNVFNCNDGAGTAPNIRNNWVMIPTENISGDLPAPVTTHISFLSYENPERVFCGHTISYAGAAPEGSYYYADQSGTADAYCSGTAYSTMSLTTDSEALVASAVLTDGTQMNVLGGAPYHVMVRFRDNTSLTDVKFELRLVIGTTNVWYSGWKRITSSSTGHVMYDMGVVNLPIGLSSSWAYGQLNLVAKRTTSSTETINVDYMAFMGAEFADIGIISGGMNPNQVIYFGGGDKLLYRYDPTNGACLDLAKVGADTLTVIPWKQNFYTFAAQCNISAPVTTKLGIRMEYRPRWSLPL